MFAHVGGHNMCTWFTILPCVAQVRRSEFCFVLSELGFVMDYDSYDHPLDDEEYPDDYDADDDWDEVELLPCPNCGADIAEDSVRCPMCGEYVMWGSSVWEGKSWWWIVLGLLGIAATILTLSVF